MAGIRCPDSPECSYCGCHNVQTPTALMTMPYRCRGNGCRRFSSVKVGTVMQDSKLGYQECCANASNERDECSRDA